MAFQTNNKSNTSKSDNKTTYNFAGVQYPKVFDNGDVVFSLLVNGIWIHGMRIINNEKAKDGWFISFPQRKGSNDKYYSYAYFSISEEDKEKIGKLVQEAINNE